jgi:small conductance mechanosensitive channel
MFNRLFGNDVQLTSVALALGVVVFVAWLGAYLAARVARVAFVSLTGADTTDRASFKAPIVRTPIRIIWTVVFLLLVATLLPPALGIAGVDIRSGLQVETLTRWLMRSGLHIALIALLTYAVIRIVGTLARRFEDELGQQAGPDGLERAKRARTLGNLIRNVVNTAMVAVATLMVLQELDINIMPVLTGAGIAGLAVGFGAQTLVRDVISGFFLILEDQVRVGDVASINGTGGLVEAINLRTIVLRDLSGTVHVFPNGAVGQMSNLTKDFSFYVLDMGVAYKEDTDQVVEVLKAVAEELRQDPAYAAKILGPLEVLGVDAFGDSAVTVKVRIKTVPIQQWSVGREYRRRVKKAFDARGIEIPFPHMSVYFGEASKPWLFRDAGTGPRPARDAGAAPNAPGTAPKASGPEANPTDAEPRSTDAEPRTPDAEGQ